MPDDSFASPSISQPASPPLVLVVSECRWGRVEKVTFELLGDARKIALAMKGLTEVVLLTSPSNSSTALADLGSYLEERVHLLEHPILEDYSTSAYIQALELLVRRLNPQIVMLGGTTNGRDLGPRLAARLGFGFLPNCLMVRPTAGGQFQITRVSHGGRVHVQAVWRAEVPLIITIRPGVADAITRRKSSGHFVVQRHSVDLRPDQVRVVKRLPADPRTQDIREADRVVAGGRGVGGPGGFALISDLAGALNAAVGASRVAVDLGWIEHARQVGQTGKTVSPKLYFAVGISGASHHLMGMQRSEKIVAINIDRQAPIFAVCHFGVVGDLHQVLPRLTQRIQDHKAGACLPPSAAEEIEA
jgi:electron transfer flavoprotein alpha subunit